MKPLTLDDIESIEAYEAKRSEVRRRIIALKNIRRIKLGPRVSLVFENRDTMKFQVQEMCRIEHIVDDELVQQEIDVYNDLLPEGQAIGDRGLIGQQCHDQQSTDDGEAFVAIGVGPCQTLHKRRQVRIIRPQLVGSDGFGGQVAYAHAFHQKQ